jgi:pimaricinolide synthase PimS1
VGEEIYAEVALPQAHAQGAERYGVHPALLDAAEHAAIDAALRKASEEGAEPAPSLPVSWRGVCISLAGVESLRVRLVPGEEGTALSAFDETGSPVLSVGSVLRSPVEQSQLRAAGRRLPLHRLEWIDLKSDSELEPGRLIVLGDAEIEGLAGEHQPDLGGLIQASENGDSPQVVVADFRTVAADESPVEASHALSARALELLQSWLSAEGLAESRLIVLTEDALAVREGEIPNLTAAPLAGLLRSAYSEHQGRFALIDTDGSEASQAALAAALPATVDEPQLALREGVALAPRLAPVEAAKPGGSPLDRDSTVLITGGTSGIGALLARHLVSDHGVRHLILASRSGANAAGSGQLRSELEELGAEVSVAACDVSDRRQLQVLLGSIPEDHPLGAVFHSAALLDDGVLGSLDSERLERVMRPKVDAAWHLHELTQDLDLSAFVLFSSAAGILGGAAQANYAAANGFLDALATYRRASGLPASAFAWGLWENQSELADAALTDADLARLAEQIRTRLGFVAMPPEQGLALLDAALSLSDPVLALVEFDRAALRAQASTGTLPAVLASLVRRPARRARGQAPFAQRLAAVAEGEREAYVLDLVRGHVAAVLGYRSADAVDPSRAFKDLGFDSLAAVELHNRLRASTGLALPPSIIFDYPRPTALAEQILNKAQIEGPGSIDAGDGALWTEFDRLETTLAGIDSDDQRDSAAARLRELLAGIEPGPSDDLSEATDEEMFGLLDQKLGRV